MTEYGLVGEKLGHSFSPRIHSQLASYDYGLIEVPKEEIDEFIEKREFKGLNVTIPYKQTVIPHLDDIDDAARKIGAVNTVVNDGGRLIGYNTDKDGMREAILRAGIDVSGKKVLICGTGGTSKTASYTAKALGAGEIVILSRKDTPGCVKYEDAEKYHKDADIIINTTPAGMYPDNFSRALDIEKFPALSGVFDAVYNPLCSALVVSAKRRGIPASGGLYMLVAQAVASSELFIHTKYPADVCEKIFYGIEREKTNIVLIGMPSSGKTTVGRILSEMTGKEFIDTDDLIICNEKKDITSIFADSGEEYFRDAETKAVKDIAPLQGKVVATGGGAVLRRENIDALHQNGRIYFLDRSLELLCATSDRPLSSDRTALGKRYDERIGIYRSECDVLIDSNGSVNDAAKDIMKDFGSKVI